MPRDTTDDLLVAVAVGNAERTKSILARGVIDIDEGTSDGFTPLMIAAQLGHSHISQILLTKGANVFIVNDHGFTALHQSAQAGHLAVTKLLVKAGADLELKATVVGATPLHLAAEGGHPEIMTVLVEAGANPNSRRADGATSLYQAVMKGHVDAIKVLLRAKASPLLTYSSPSGSTYVPLDVAAQNGHLEVARELIQGLGIEGCGGASGGVAALRGAAQNQHVEVMELLTSAGVVDTGVALFAAAYFGKESSVKFLLQQQEGKSSGERAAYLNTGNQDGKTPLVYSIQASRSRSPRVARMLVDAGADTTTAVRLSDEKGRVLFNGTPLALADSNLRSKKVGGKDATESQLNSLEGTRRLLLAVEAVHAVSWLWPSATHLIRHGTESERFATATSNPLARMLPILRRRAGRRDMLLAAMRRYYQSKPQPALLAG